MSRHLSRLAALVVLAPATAQIQLGLDQSEPGWHGATVVPDGARGNAAHFDGQDARIDAGPLPVDGSKPFTLTASLRTSRGSFCTPLMARSGEAVGVSLVLGREPGRISFEAWSWESVRLLSRTRVDDGRWHEVRASYDPGSTMALLYVDGALEASAELGQGASLQATLRLGDNIGAHQPYLGDLDEVKFHAEPPPATDLALAVPAVPKTEKAAALAALRERLLPGKTPSLEATALPQWEQRRKAVRAHVADCLGLVPEPPRGDLDVLTYFERNGPEGSGYVLQRISWRAFPGERATGWLWLPDPMPAGKRPAVLCPHGHWAEGAIDPVVQARCQAFASFGWVVLAVDSVHVENVAAGLSPIGVMTWHNLRALDLLAGRADVDSQKIAVTGASGGAQQSYYLMALDDRLAAVAPMVMACYFREIVSDTSAHCGCNHLPRLAAGTDVIEMCSVFAPRPVLFGSVTGDWTAHFPQQGLPELQRLWQHLGHGERIASRHANEGHNYDRPMRERVYAFLGSVLEPGRAAGTLTEPALHPQPVAVLRGLDRELEVPRPDATLLAAEHVQRRAKVSDPRLLAPNLPWKVEPAAIEWRGAEDLPWRPASVKGADGVPVPMFVVRDTGADPLPWTVVVAEGGATALRRGDAAWLNGPRRVLVDARFTGEWQSFAPSWRRNGLLLGCGEGYQSAHDTALAAASLPGKAPVRLVGLGNAGVTVLMAADLCPRVQQVIAEDLGVSFAQDGNRLPLCPEILRLGDPFAFFTARLSRCELVLGGATTAGAPRPRLLATDLARLLRK